jgi:hypothetical protein
MHRVTLLVQVGWDVCCWQLGTPDLLRVLRLRVRVCCNVLPARSGDLASLIRALPPCVSLDGRLPSVLHTGEWRLDRPLPGFPSRVYCE